MRDRGAVVVAAALLGALVGLLSAPVSRAATSPCTPWDVRTIASGLGDPSAVKFGCGPGWQSDHLFVVGFQGDVYDVSPPAGVRAPRGNCDAASG